MFGQLWLEMAPFGVKPHARKAHGLGQRALQKKRRKQLSATLSERLFGILDMDSVEATGSLYPRCADLRKKKTKGTCF